MLRYKVIGMDKEIEVAYELTHGARFIMDFYADGAGCLHSVTRVSTQEETSAAWKNWRNG